MHDSFYRTNVGTHVCSYNPFCICINDGTHYILLVDSGQSMTYSEYDLQIEVMRMMLTRCPPCKISLTLGFKVTFVLSKSELAF